jgi:hypothetical protein
MLPGRFFGSGAKMWPHLCSQSVVGVGLSLINEPAWRRRTLSGGTGSCDRSNLTTRARLPVMVPIGQLLLRRRQLVGRRLQCSDGSLGSEDNWMARRRRHAVRAEVNTSYIVRAAREEGTTREG